MDTLTLEPLLEWLTVLGYLAFLGVVIWQVLSRSPNN